MRKLIIAALAVLVLAAPALASQASTSASSPFRSIADTITGQGVLVVVDTEHRVTAYDVDVWGRGYVAVPHDHPAAETLIALGAEVDRLTGVIPLVCLRSSRDALTLEPGQGGYAAFCQ